MAAGEPAQQPRDGLRKIAVPRFGITVHAPVAWNLVSWGQDERAFVLRLPQENPASEGTVSCELSTATESLDAIRRRLAAAEQAEQKKPHPARKLSLDRIAAVDAKQFGAARAKQLVRRLDSQWDTAAAPGHATHELATRFIVGDILYTFRLRTDQAHFDAYRADFEEMLAEATIKPPETGVEHLPGGLWMQRDYRFAMRLPRGWQPAFAASNRVLFFAHDTTRSAPSSRLTVMASHTTPLDLDKLRDRLTGAIKAADPKADVTARIVKQGVEPALEMIVRTKQGDTEITTLERRFRGPHCNYEVKFRCESADFKRLQPALRKSLDSFVEVAEPAKKDAT